MPVTLDTSHLEISLLNDVAPENIEPILVTLDTFQLEISPLNDDAAHVSNNPLMSATDETSQDPIGPCGPLEQLVGESWRHCTVAALSSSLDFGAHAVVARFG